MLNKHRENRIQTKLTYLLVIGYLLTFVVSCQNGGPDPAAEIRDSVSLCTVTPYIGDETEIRDPAPLSSRLVIGNDSVEGWDAPDEGSLKFPVAFRSGAYLSLSVGAISDEPPDTLDLTLRAEIIRIVNGKPGNPEKLFELGPERIEDYFYKWLPVKVSLDQWAVFEGEIRFNVEGQDASDDGTKIFWGQPSIYNPEYNRNKNILLIGIDTLRASSCSPYGAEPNRTPGLTRFAGTGVVFSNTRAQAPWTLPSFASMITGRMPSSIAATGYNEQLPEFSKTVGEILREHGYATETVATNPWLGKPNSGFEQGMDNLWYRNDARANVTTTRARNFINSNQDRDWFCFLHMNDPHTAYLPMVEYIDMFCDPEYEGRYGEEFTDTELWGRDGYIPQDEDIAQVRGLHEGEVAYVDKYLDELFTWMNETGVMEDTLVIFAADHGEEFFEHGRFGHGYSQYDDLVKTPLIISAPEIPMGETIDTPVGNIDIVPTILKFAGIDIPQNMIGIPLQDVIDGNIEERLILGEETGQVMHKYVLDWPLKAIIDFVSGKIQVFNIEEDPGELDDIVSSLDEAVLEEFTASAMMNMYPVQNLFIVGVLGNPDEPTMRFSGMIEISGGYDRLRQYALQDGDVVEENGDTINFDFSSTINDHLKRKLIVIYPSSDTAELTAIIKINGMEPGERFLPYGTFEPELSGQVTVSLDEFPWPAGLPEDYEQRMSSCYILAYKGISDEIIGDTFDEMSSEEREKLRALGYLN